jgi:glycosyltransferase involved in cell wall biosynthesis
MNKKKIVIITDAWNPQTNGVVTTYKSISHRLIKLGYDVDIIHPGNFNSFPLPFYPEIRAALPYNNYLKKYSKEKNIAFHIATEFILGASSRIFLKKNGWEFTSSFCTMFPDYLKKHAHIPLWVTWKYIRWIHNNSNSCMAATNSIKNILKDRGINKIKMWGRGVDTSLFYPDLERKPNEVPVALYVGRVSKEKNLEAFLSARNKVKKVVVGDGPMLEYYKSIYKDVEFRGILFGDDLRKVYQSADVFVFPSLTDTFGLVMVEALACGVPVAAYNIQGPKDIIDNEHTGCIQYDNLELNIDEALRLGKRQDCIERAAQFNWDKCTELFINNLVFNKSLK